jgi:hypothetical protein
MGGAEPDPPRDPVKTLKELKLRSALFEPHWGHSGLLPSEYSDMDIRTSKETPQSAHL